MRALEDIVDHHRLVRAVEGTDPQVHDAGVNSVRAYCGRFTAAEARSTDSTVSRIESSARRRSEQILVKRCGLPASELVACVRTPQFLPSLAHRREIDAPC